MSPKSAATPNLVCKCKYVQNRIPRIPIQVILPHKMRLHIYEKCGAAGFTPERERNSLLLLSFSLFLSGVESYGATLYKDVRPYTQYRQDVSQSVSQMSCKVDLAVTNISRLVSHAATPTPPLPHILRDINSRLQNLELSNLGSALHFCVRPLLKRQRANPP